MLFVSSFLMFACGGTDNNPFKPDPPIKTSDISRCEDCKIYASVSTYYITPSGFDWENLEQKGYDTLSIVISYTVSYQKNWKIGLGYLGAPKYEVTLANSDWLGNTIKNQVAPSNATQRSHSFSLDIVNVEGTRLTLSFSSDNVQNNIYFKNITIIYRCY